MSGAVPTPGSGNDEQAGPALPRTILIAIRLMYLGAALTALLGVLRLLDPDAFRDALDDQSTGEVGRLSGDSQLGGYVFFAFVVAGVWLWVARRCRMGRPRARRAASVFGGLYIAFTVVALFLVDLNASTVVSVVIMVVAGAVLWFLYQPPSNQHFAPK